ncbi:beta-lactamase domain protein [Denitrovibrio acetiphilus DSM 12809]|uniref:Beta-lactamase domain protein n=1 Tax=Denitrovibrio acetiphilus (strain DSM 12809 / NBRC 114555 / N2460) TaxID=522772 RepID=D4H2A9_DENA2|nr:MBL fold metallo-hydrolase [Denitrovibrio acetiphilus]ADD68900.1 beta-lactamase domain protein [Denitrovibrio acetiphilus DSM 12809]
MKQHTAGTPYCVGDVHFYTLETETGFVMFDTGPPTTEMRDYLNNNLNLQKLEKVFVTHCHIDHCGMLDFLASNSDAEIYIPRVDSIMCRNNLKRLKTIRTLCIDMGFSAEITEKMLGMYDHVNFIPDKHNILEDSVDALKELNLSYTSFKWHSQSDIVFMHENLAISGDIMLQDIFTTPLIDSDANDLQLRFNNYGHFCEALVRLSKIGSYKLLPGHRKTLDDQKQWLIFYISKTLQRTIKLLPRLGKESPAEIVRSIICDMDSKPYDAFIKLSEIMFFKDILAKPELLKDTLSTIGLYDNFRQQLDLL